MEIKTSLLLIGFAVICMVIAMMTVMTNVWVGVIFGGMSVFSSSVALRLRDFE